MQKKPFKMVVTGKPFKMVYTCPPCHVILSIKKLQLFTSGVAGQFSCNVQIFILTVSNLYLFHGCLVFIVYYR